MNERIISLEVATDLAWVYRDAFDAYKDTLRSFEDTSGLDDLGVELGATAMRDLRNELVVSIKSLDRADRAIPSFLSEVVLPNQETAIEQEAIAETLTPEELEFKESLLEGFEIAYSTYTSLIDVMNNTEERENDKLEAVSEQEAKAAIDTLLTPNVIWEAARQVEEFTHNPEPESPTPGFDIVLLPNKNLSESDEAAVAKDIQSRLPAYKGDDYVYSPLYNQDTAHKANGIDANLVALLAPKHLNIRRAEATNAKTPTGVQREDLESQNKTLAADDVELVTGMGMAAMAHISQLIETGAIDIDTKEYIEERFWVTCYKDILGVPVGGCVSSVYVNVITQLSRDGSLVDSGGPSRALVVNKL